MGEDWALIDLDKETFNLLGPPGIWIYGGRLLVEVLARPVPSVEPSVKELIKPFQRSSKGLFKLPLELLDAILVELSAISRSSLLAFVMVNRTLYTIGFKRFQAALCEYEVPCTGHRLISLGTSYDPDDLPPGFHPEDLEKASAAWGQCNGEEGDFWFYSYAQNRFSQVWDFDTWGSGWFRRWATSDEGRYCPYLLPTYKSEVKALDDLLKRRYPSDLKWVLCNLTKRVYFTAEKVTNYTGEKRGSAFWNEMKAVGQVLLSHISWTDPHPAEDGCGIEFQHGKWATDRFEFTTMDRLSDLKPVEGGATGNWEDVSDVMVKETWEMCTPNFGPWAV